MIICSKEYHDIPFAHRQHNHAGHCSLIHGHNWGFKFTFIASELDKNGFVIDFGKLGQLKVLLETLDHALVLNEDDPHLEYLQKSLMGQEAAFARIVVLPNGSSEGLATHFLKVANETVKDLTIGRVSCLSCEVFEDSKNSAKAIKNYVSDDNIVVVRMDDYDVEEEG